MPLTELMRLTVQLFVADSTSTVNVERSSSDESRSVNAEFDPGRTLNKSATESKHTEVVHAAAAVVRVVMVLFALQIIRGPFAGTRAHDV